MLPVRHALQFTRAATLRVAVWSGVVLLGLTDAQAILLYDSNNPATNTTAPTGIYADSGWSFQGQYGSYLGTMIAPQYFITANHFPLQGGTFVSTAALNGVADVTYTIDASANGGTGFWNIAGTDLRIFKINETFSSYAPLYTGSGEVGLSLVVFGRGGVRGAEVLDGATVKGWLHNNSDGVARWGENQVSSIEASGVGPLLAAQFNAVGGQNEASLSDGDSGGGVFVFEGGQWFLAGINYASDGLFDTNNTTGDASEFRAGLTDMGGFYVGSDGGGWTLVPDNPTDIPSRFYASRISSNIAAIQSIAGVPEPASVWLLAMSAMLLTGRRCRGSATASLLTC